MPDYVNDSNKCKSTSGAFSNTCTLGDPPYNAHQFNTIYYDPSITYSPGLTSLGVEKTAMTSANTTGWTVVPVDAYGIQSTSNTSLVPNATNSTGYSDRVWCNATSLTTAQIVTALSATSGTMCKRNSQYIYRTSTFNQPFILKGHPYYYTVAPGEYCTNKNLTGTCNATSGGAFTFPATLRWCNSAALTNCQAKYLETTGYTYAKWSGIVNASSATGSIQIGIDPLGLASPSALSVTAITVNGLSIIPASPSPALTITDTTNSGQRGTLATNVASAINAFTSTPDFTATASGDVVTITNSVSGAFTGTINVTTTSYTAPATAGIKATGSITVNSASNGTTTVGSITVNGIEIMGGTGAGCGTATSTSSGGGSTRRAALATALAAKITACTSSPNYVATASGSTVTITASVAGSASNGAIVISTLANSPGFDPPVGMAGGDSGHPRHIHCLRP